MNFPTAAGEVETHKFQLSIVYHLLLFSVGVRRLPRSRFLASAMLSKDSTRTELGKRPIPTRRVGHNLNTITYRRSLLSRQPNSYHRGNRKDKREDNLVSHSLLLFGYSGNNQVTSSPGWDRHRTTRPGPRCVPPFFLFHYPLIWSWGWTQKFCAADGRGLSFITCHTSTRACRPLQGAREFTLRLRRLPASFRIRLFSFTAAFAASHFEAKYLGFSPITIIIEVKLAESGARRAWSAQVLSP